jgi:7,8-dihydropterin-6-yl-methyl-4-(beta-D-ribofuranosyl)aminobenzene 5'-phosphate synthase
MESFMKVAVFVFLVSAFFYISFCSSSQTSIDERVEEETAFMNEARKKDSQLSQLLKELAKTEDLEKMLRRFYRGKKEAEEDWIAQQVSIQKLEGMGATKSLVILPLVEWYANREDLKTEAGVSYLIKTDSSTILYDLGMNLEETDPSPLMYNMERLGIGLNDFDTIVISHNHSDHVGGSKWSREKTFSLTTSQIDLGAKRVYTPIPMTYPGLEPVCTSKPMVLAKGVATIGVISNEMFAWGRTSEQALAVNVEGKGIVIVSGCGHQSLKKMLERSEILFEEPLYGLIGGLHYPVTGSREVWKGIDKIQIYMGTGKVPWRPITMEEIQDHIDCLKKRKPKVVGLSPHDSCDAVLEAFQAAFSEGYELIEVGRKIRIASD